MASTTSNTKPTLDEVITKIMGEYPEIFHCGNQKMLFEADFKLLVRTFVTERGVSDSTWVS